MLSKCELDIINNDKLLRLASICVRLHTHALQTSDVLKDGISEHIPQEQQLSDVIQLLLWEDAQKRGE